MSGARKTGSYWGWKQDPHKDTCLWNAGEGSQWGGEAWACQADLPSNHGADGGHRRGGGGERLGVRGK